MAVDYIAMFFSVGLQLVLLVFSVSAQSHGDVRFVDSDQNNTGRVEIFYEGKWGTICDVNYSGAANTVCYQLNHTSNSVEYPGTSTELMNKALFGNGSGHKIGNSTTSRIALRDIDCGGIYSTPLATIHILRCVFQVVDRDHTECSHGNDLAVYCDDPSEQDPYDSEIRLVGGEFSSLGTLEIYHSGEWGNICYQGFDKTAADTACRQMGYTHAKELSATRDSTSTTVWLAGSITCGKEDACLSECVSEKSFNKTSHCLDGNYVRLRCDFDSDPASAEGVPSGNAIRCSLRRKFSKTPAYFLAIMGVSSGLWAVSTGVIIVTAVCYSVERCPCYKMRLRRRQTDFTYYSINK